MNNCIGFYNHKFFMSMIINSCCLLFLFTMSYAEHVNVHLFNLEYKRYFYLYLITFTFALGWFLFFIMMLFTTWNVMMILFAKTSIEMNDRSLSVRKIKYPYIFCILKIFSFISKEILLWHLS